MIQIQKIVLVFVEVKTTRIIVEFVMMTLQMIVLKIVLVFGVDHLLKMNVVYVVVTIQLVRIAMEILMAKRL